MQNYDPQQDVIPAAPEPQRPVPGTAKAFSMPTTFPSSYNTSVTDGSVPFPSQTGLCPSTSSYVPFPESKQPPFSSGVPSYTFLSVAVAMTTARGVTVSVP